jgi:replication initiation and membrane attachment protein DnaB
MKRFWVNVLCEDIPVGDFDAVMVDAVESLADNIDYVIDDYDNISKDFNDSISYLEYSGSQHKGKEGLIDMTTGILTALFDIVDEEIEEDFDVEAFKKRIMDETVTLFDNKHDIERVVVSVNEILVK